MSQPDYQASIDYILSFADYERVSRTAVVFDTSRIEALMERLGQPHLAAESIHIAGTKGKGSTAAMIASTLTASGYNTGLYTSPHLHSFTERIRIDGDPIPEAAFAALVQRLKPEFDAFNQLGAYGELSNVSRSSPPSPSSTSKSVTSTSRVLETGLGGRLDATNVVHPHASRLVGPPLAGVIIAVANEGICFLVNGLSYIMVIAALLMIKVKPFEHTGVRKKRNK